MVTLLPFKRLKMYNQKWAYSHKGGKRFWWKGWRWSRKSDIGKHFMLKKLSEILHDIEKFKGWKVGSCSKLTKYDNLPKQTKKKVLVPYHKFYIKKASTVKVTLGKFWQRNTFVLNVSNVLTCNVLNTILLFFIFLYIYSWQ